MIEIQNLHFAYRSSAGEIPVLKGVDLSFREGESVALIGANGSGKTTLIRCINGLLKPSEGDVRVDGLSVREADQMLRIRRRVGMVFQNPDDQIVSAQVERDVAFGLENIGVPTGEMQERVSDVLARLGLARYRSHAPHLLSGGERQRLALAGVLAMRPRYLLLDEPTALLDPAGRRALLAILKELHDAAEVTPIAVTQIPEEAAEMDRVVALADGQVVLDGTPEEVFSEADQLRQMGLGLPASAEIAHRAGISGRLPLSPDGLVDRLSAPSRVTQGATSDHGQAPCGPPVVVARGLRHVYNPGLLTEIVGLGGLDLELAGGSVVAMVGPSGSGKSTFAQHLNGLLQPTSGSLKVCGFDLAETKDLRVLRQRVGLIFQFPEAQLFADTVSADVSFGPTNLGLDDVEGRVGRALEEVGLSPQRFGQRNPFALSGGEKRRVAIAGVLAMRPEVLVLDEPTAGLDASGVTEIENLLEELNRQGATLILITHDMDVVARLADRVIALEAGRIGFDLSPEDALSERDRLVGLQLDLPEAVQVAEALRERGWGIPREALTVEAVARSLKELLEGSP